MVSVGKRRGLISAWTARETLLPASSSARAVIGAVVGEFVGADEGLGFLVNLGRGLYDTALVFVALLMLVTIALSLYSLAALLEHKTLAWREVEKSQ